MSNLSTALAHARALMEARPQGRKRAGTSRSSGKDGEPPGSVRAAMGADEEPDDDSEEESRQERSEERGEESKDKDDKDSDGVPDDLEVIAKVDAPPIEEPSPSTSEEPPEKGQEVRSQGRGGSGGSPPPPTGVVRYKIKDLVDTVVKRYGGQGPLPEAELDPGESPSREEREREGLEGKAPESIPAYRSRALGLRPFTT